MTKVMRLAILGTQIPIALNAAFYRSMWWPGWPSGPEPSHPIMHAVGWALLAAIVVLMVAVGLQREPARGARSGRK